MPSWLRTALFLSLCCFIFQGCGLMKSSLPDLGIVPAFSLTDETGKEFRSEEKLKGKVWVADFIFTHCPGPCPRMTQHMRRVQEETKHLPEVHCVSFTVDPKRDTPQVLNDYARRFSAEAAHWSFLTGPPEELQRLSKDAFKLGDIAPDFEHSTRFALVDKNSHIRGYYSTTEPSFRTKLIEDIKDLAKD